MDRRKKQTQIILRMNNFKNTLRATVIVFLLSGYTLAQTHTFELFEDVVYATPKDFELTMDIYVPETGKDSYPVLVIWHGGGWLINSNEIMDDMSAYMASKGEYIVCNVNYRLLGDLDNTTTMNEIVEDVFGSLLWIKVNIEQYGGNPLKIAITGDSAGGHLSSMVLTHGDKLESDGFDGDSFGFNPSWLPEGKTAEEVAMENGLEVQAAVISYGAFDLHQASLYGFETEANGFWRWGGAKARGLFGNNYNATDHEERYRAVSPIYSIPEASERQLPPQFHHVGSNDGTTTPASILAYVDQLKAKGQPVTVEVIEGKNHAYLDSGCNEFLGSCFDEDAIPILDKILVFLDEELDN